MKKIRFSLVLLFAVFISLAPARAMEFRTSLDIDYQSLSLSDPSDSIYVGEFNKGGTVGINGHADWLFEMSPGFSVGPDFDFSYGTIVSIWDTHFAGFQIQDAHKRLLC